MEELTKIIRIFKQQYLRCKTKIAQTIRQNKERSAQTMKNKQDPLITRALVITFTDLNLGSLCRKKEARIWLTFHINLKSFLTKKLDV